MFFPKLIPKQAHFSKDQNWSPFPVLEEGEPKPVGVFTGFAVEILDKAHIKMLCKNGCYGGGSKSRNVPEVTRNYSESSDEMKGNFVENLVLDLEEAFFLSHILEVLIVNDLSGHEIPKKTFWNRIIQIKDNFPQTLIGYIYLKSKNWVVKSGIQFGGDFLIYKHDVRSYHASFIVLIRNGTVEKPEYIQSIVRIAETTNKDVLILEIIPPHDVPINNSTEYLDFIDMFTVKEMIPRRFDFKQFV